jgi:hypothetical protein
MTYFFLPIANAIASGSSTSTEHRQQMAASSFHPIMG